MKCIYCLEDKPITCFKKTEHVLPQSFGKFRNNFTLNKIVCDSCNEYFGNHLEILLGRDTFEGVERFVHNVKKPKEFKSVGKKSRISVQVNDGPFKGAYAYQEYSKNEGNIIIKPLPQIGFKDNNAEYVYFLLDDVPDKEYLENNFNLKIPKSIATLGCSVDLAQKCLAKKGITFNFEAEFSPEVDSLVWDCEVTVLIDQIIFRAIAKIAFNYLAYYAGPVFVSNISFHPIRRYIRYGEKQSHPFVIIMDKPILGDEKIEGKRRLGHLVILDWSLNNTSYVSKVSLFNHSTYSVVLAKDYVGEIYRRGNFFNIGNYKIYELLPGDMVNKS